MSPPERHGHGPAGVTAKYDEKLLPDETLIDGNTYISMVNAVSAVISSDDGRKWSQEHPGCRLFQAEASLIDIEGLSYRWSVIMISTGTMLTADVENGRAVNVLEQDMENLQVPSDSEARIYDSNAIMSLMAANQSINVAPGNMLFSLGYKDRDGGVYNITYKDPFEPHAVCHQHICHQWHRYREQLSRLVRREYLLKPGDENAQWLLLSAVIVSIGLGALVLLLNNAVLSGHSSTQAITSFPKNELRDLRSNSINEAMILGQDLNKDLSIMNKKDLFNASYDRYKNDTGNFTLLHGGLVYITAVPETYTWDVDKSIISNISLSIAYSDSDTTYTEHVNIGILG